MPRAGCAGLYSTIWPNKGHGAHGQARGRPSDYNKSRNRPMRENELLKICRLAAAECGATLFRNNRGMFLTLDGKRKIRAGLEAPGTSDLIGWDKHGRFVAIEVKTSAGRLSPEQKTFLNAVKSAGGIAFIARSPEDVKNNLK